MKIYWTSYNIKIIKFLITLLLFGIVIGFIIYHQQSTTIKTGIMHELSLIGDSISKSRNNNLVHHFLLFSVIMVLSLVVIGFPLVLFYYFYEGVSLGFLLAGLWHYQKFKGLIFGLVFIIVNKLVLFVVLIYLILVSIKYSVKIILTIKNRDSCLRINLLNQLFRLLFTFVVILIYDLFLYFGGNKILSYFLFLL